ncbi:MAG: iron-sulfur cluster assembly protein [Candidatus Caldarchaeum sp.]
MGVGKMLSRLFGKGEEEKEGVTTPIDVRKEVDEELSSGSDSEALRQNEAENPQITKELILERLSEIYDPEIPIDIVNLGLIYDVEIDDGKVHVKMTMTSPGCPTSGQIAQECQFVIEEIPGVKEAWVEIVWDPPWDPSKMSEEARLSLGFG